MKTDNNIFEQLQKQQQLRKMDYDAGFKAGYLAKEKEMLEREEKEEIEMADAESGKEWEPKEKLEEEL